ncbi:MAG: DUF1700 domain-containing protein [Lachnospiraceae bacterium]|nr:DUF1700 domain-containing protein [Lachnospiraceae bacterium]
MNRNEFLKELEKRLLYIPTEDRQDALEYYDEYIKDMGLGEEEDVIAKLGTPKDVARNIIDDCTQKHIEQTKENKTFKGKATVIWLSLLGILSLPLSLPLGIAILALAIAFVITVLAICFALFVSSLACTISGVVIFVFSFFVPGIGQKVLTLGAGLALAGLGLLLGLLIITIVRSVLNRIFRRNRIAKEEMINE